MAEEAPKDAAAATDNAADEAADKAEASAAAAKNIPESTAVGDYLKKEDIYDKDLEEILLDQGIKDPSTDFKTYTEKQYEDLYRRAVVERAKELKDQKAKVRLEQKLTKIEKYYRSESGNKKTSIKPGSKAADDDAKSPPDQSSAAAQNELLEKAADLKKYLMKNGCYNLDLLAVLSDHGVNKEADIATVKTNMEFNTIKREISVKQRGKLKDSASKNRADKIVTKYEKLWRTVTGVKSTSVTDGTSDKKKEAAPKDKKNEELAGKGKKLKTYLKKAGIFNQALYDELISNNVLCYEDFKTIKEKQFDKIVRKVRVERFKDIKEAAARQRADKVLIAFEKTWRKESGIKKTSIKKKKK